LAWIAALHGLFENQPAHDGRLDPRSLILIWDTGALFGLTLFRSDFIDYVECDIPVHDVTKVNKVIGIGTTLHNFTNTNENFVYLPCVLYHLPETDVRLFSPQTYHQIPGGYSEVYGQSVQMKLHTSTIATGISRDLTNLPVVFDSFVSEKAKWALGACMWSGLCQMRLSELDFFGNIDQSFLLLQALAGQSSFPCFPCVGDPLNLNLTSPQRELCLWHWKLGINMHRVQALMQELTYEDTMGRCTIPPPIIKPKFPSARNCVVPACQSCLIARAQKQSTNMAKTKAIPKSEGALSHDKYEVRDFVSTDLFICRTPG
jgi:hypothetical protein